MERRIAVVGLGYVGLPLAVAFGRHAKVIGFDSRPERIEELAAGCDSTREVLPADLAATDISFTTDAALLRQTDFIIVAVPTPITMARRPDLAPIESASRSVGENLAPGAIVVYESTVYPGVTEEICAPILEKASGLKSGRDFFVGYSPERINPGDREHTVERIIKIVAGQTPEVLDIIAEVYGSVVTAGVHRAPNIKTAEAAKVIENTQRDLNIALVNELSMIFDRMGIDTQDVLRAAATKWNFLPFYPGLVGGHCIGVDPYYLTHKAEELGYKPEVILAGRRINDMMGEYVAQKLIKIIVRKGVNPNGARVGILGLTFKEDVPDLRNTKVVDVRRELREYGVDVLTHDPVAYPEDASDHYGIDLAAKEDLKDLDAVVLAVAHSEYREWGAGWIRSILRPNGVVIDVKRLFSSADFAGNLAYWGL